MACIHSSPNVLARSLLLASVSVLVSPLIAVAQTRSQDLPSVIVDAPKPQRANVVRAPRSARAARPARVPAPSPQTASDQNQGTRGALAVLSAQQALAEINQTPGGVALVPASAYRNSTVANTIKDILD